MQTYGNVILTDDTAETIAQSSDYLEVSDVPDMITVEYEPDSIHLADDGSVNPATSKLLYITVRSLTEEDAEILAEVVKNEISSYKPNAKKLYGEHTISLVGEQLLQSRDEDIAAIQDALYDTIYNLQSRINNLTTNFTDEQKQVLSNYKLSIMEDEQLEESVEMSEESSTQETEVSVSKKWIVFGAFVGIFLILLWDGVCWIFSGVLNSKEELSSNLGIHICGEFAGKKKSKVCQRLSGIVNGNKKNLTVEESYNMLVSEIGVMCETRNIHQIYLTGTKLEKSVAKEYVSDLQSKLGDKGIDLICEGNILYDADAFLKMTEIGYAVFWEETKVSNYNDIVKALNKCQEYQVDVLGAIVVEN